MPTCTGCLETRPAQNNPYELKSNS